MGITGADIPRQEHRSERWQQGISLVVQWLRPHAPNAGGPGSIPGQETRFCMLQLKILHAATKTGHRPKKKNKDIVIFPSTVSCLMPRLLALQVDRPATLYTFQRVIMW